MESDWAFGLMGGLLIGLSSAVFLLFNGNIAGISGLVGGVVQRLGSEQTAQRLLFLGGLLAGALAASVLAREPQLTIAAPIWMIVIAGLLVGVGTRFANGCTSGHGVCGMSRGSKRSIVATLTFMATAVAVATAMSS